MIVYGGDNADTKTQSDNMAAALNQAGFSPDSVEFPAKNHFTMNEHIGVSGDATTIVVERFLRSIQ